MTQPLTVHVRVNDAATGRPTPVRIRFTDPAGTYHAPLGRLTEFPTGRGEDVGGNILWEGKEYAYIDGTCEIQLPPGPLVVEIHKGPEYESLRHEIQLGPGQLTLRFAIARRFDLRAEGWYSGDTRAHFLSPHAALLEGQAEDLAFVNLLALEERNSDQVRYSNILAFSGQKPALEAPGHAVFVNTLNHDSELGSLALLNCHRIVFPLSSGGGAEGVPWSLADWCGQCHRKGGLAVWCPSFSNAGQIEAGADVILGNVDAFEWPDVHLVEWDAFLNAGRRLPLAGGSGKASNRELLGSPRTYARLESGAEPSYSNWIEAVREGRTFATRGPLLSLEVNQHDIGATICLRSGEEKVWARLRLLNPCDADLVMIANGAPVARKSVLVNDATLEAEVRLPNGGWLAGCLWDSASRRLLAHTSAVYIQVEGKPAYSDPETVKLLDSDLESKLTWVDQSTRCATEGQREQFRAIFAGARRVLQERVLAR